MAKKLCGHITLHNGKAFKCIETWGTEHSHQDHSTEKRVKRGEAKVVPLTAQMVQMVVDQLAEFLEVNMSLTEQDAKAFTPYLNKVKS